MLPNFDQDLMEAHNIKVDPKTGRIDVSEFELAIL